MPYNSLYLRIKISLMNLYHNRIQFAKPESEREKWMGQADMVGNEIDAILVSADYSKYRYTYEILKSRINIYRINSAMDVNILMDCKMKLQQIADGTKNGNVILYKAAEEMVDEYEEAIKWLLDQQSQ